MKMARIGAFGDLLFEVSYFKILSFDKWQRTTKHRYATHNIMNYKPKLESVGKDLETISLEILFHTGLGVDPRTETEKLRTMCNNGEVNYLIVGAEVIGNCLFVIEEVSEAVEHWSGTGQILTSRVTVKFKEYASAGDF